MKDYMAHYRSERNHQGKNNVLLFQQVADTRRDSPVRCRDRLAGLCGTIIEKRRENRNLAIALCFTDVGRARLPTGVKRSIGIEWLPDQCARIYTDPGPRGSRSPGRNAASRNSHSDPAILLPQ
jgi:hypothetical protein